jgi:hypothetical protein
MKVNLFWLNELAIWLLSLWEELLLNTSEAYDETEEDQEENQGWEKIQSLQVGVIMGF